MRLLCFSDWRVQPVEDVYGFLNTLDPKPDFILYAGDDVQRFQQDGINHFSELANYTNQRCVLAVAGNDDLALLKLILKKENVQDLHDSAFVFGDFAFLGLEAQPLGQDYFNILKKKAKVT